MTQKNQIKFKWPSDVKIRLLFIGSIIVATVVVLISGPFFVHGLALLKSKPIPIGMVIIMALPVVFRFTQAVVKFKAKPLVSTAQVFFWGGMMVVLIVSGFAELLPGLPILYATGWLLSAVGCVIYAFNLLLADNASA